MFSMMRRRISRNTEDITDTERNRRADMAEEMFREVKRRAGDNG